MKQEVIDNLSKREDFHHQWVDSYRTGIIKQRLDVVMAKLFDQAGMDPGMLVLDAGCGTGANTRRLLDRGLRVTAVDFSEFAAAETKKVFGDQADVRQMSLTHLDFADATFDHVLCSGVLMHIPDIEAALRELTRVLKPGGTLMITEGSDLSPEFLLRRLFWRLARKTHTVKPTSSGVEVWSQTAGGPLLARKLNDAWLKRFLKDRSLDLQWQGVGFLSDLFLNFRSAWGMKLVVSMNDLWFRLQPKTRLSGDMMYVFAKRLPDRAAER